MSEIEEDPAGDQTESLRLLQENELWLFLAPPGAEPNVANARVCADENSDESEPLDWNMMLAVLKMITEGNTILLVTKHETHLVWAAQVARTMGWMAMVPRSIRCADLDDDPAPDPALPE
jgi:hypothetical protein